MKSRIAIAALVATLAVAFVGPSAGPGAQAASGVSYCFKHTNGSAVTGSTVRTHLYAWSNGGWSKWLASATTDIRGCGSFYLTGTYRNYNVRVFVTVTAGPSVWAGESPYYAPPGTWSGSLGTGTVYQLR
jgi:hypothetical protein